MPQQNQPNQTELNGLQELLLQDQGIPPAIYGEPTPVAMTGGWVNTYITNEALQDMRNWVFNDIDAHLRREIYLDVEGRVPCGIIPAIQKEDKFLCDITKDYGKCPFSR